MKLSAPTAWMNSVGEEYLVSGIREDGDRVVITFNRDTYASGLSFRGAADKETLLELLKLDTQPQLTFRDAPLSMKFDPPVVWCSPVFTGLQITITRIDYFENGHGVGKQGLIVQDDQGIDFDVTERLEIQSLLYLMRGLEAQLRPTEPSRDLREALF